jgi:hypothetical protein
MVAGRQVFHHPGCRGRDYILQKLLTFLREHDAPLPFVMTVLQAATNQLPIAEHANEAAPLQQELEKVLSAKRGPKPIGEILTVVLARLGVSDLQLIPSEDQDPN